MAADDNHPLNHLLYYSASFALWSADAIISYKVSDRGRDTESQIEYNTVNSGVL
jgi:hypothetical protein